MYPFEVSEVIVTELVANALDAGATRIHISFDPHKNVLIVADDGAGMTSDQFEEYHDFAAGLKQRGAGIGFAGVGAKISFNVADAVVTETKSRSFQGGSNWYLKSKKRLIWEDVEATKLTDAGTRVEIRFRSNAKLTFSSGDDLLTLLRRHYLPLLDVKFLELYGKLGFYSNNLRFVINGKVIEPIDIVAHFRLEKVKKFFPTKGRKNYGYGVLGVGAEEYCLAPDVCGVAVCTRGKIVKAELFNQFPGALGPRLFGVVEIPDLVNFLTTSKTDFTFKGKYKQFERLYSPVREEFKAWLKELGLSGIESERGGEAAKLERELKKLIDEIPELNEFFAFRAQRQVLQESDAGVVVAEKQEGADVTFADGAGVKGKNNPVLGPGEEPGESLVANTDGAQKALPISRTGRRGPKIAFVEAPDRVDLAWIDGNNVVVNSAHASYAKARHNPLARKIHRIFAIASAIQRFLANEGHSDHLTFIDRMMAAWGKK